MNDASGKSVRSVASRGFTLIEMLVVGVMMIILSTATIYYATAWQQNARDQKRMADVNELRTVFLNYAIENDGQLPKCNVGITIDYDNWVHKDSSSTDCADEDIIKDIIATHFPNGIGDPKGPGDPDYFYYYDYHVCEHPESDDDLAYLIFAVNLESRESNVNKVGGACHDQNGNQGGYMRTNTSWLGGTKNPSRPFAVVLERY